MQAGLLTQAALSFIERHGKAGQRRHRKPRHGITARDRAWRFPARADHETRNTAFFPPLRRCQREQPQARPTVFHETRITAFPRLFRFAGHETRNTRHESRPFYTLNQFPAFMFRESFVALWLRNSRGFAAVANGPFPKPLSWEHGRPRPSGVPNKSNPKPGQPVFHETRDTRHGLFDTKHETRITAFTHHETRNTAFFRITAF